MNVNPAHAPEPLGQPGAHLRGMAPSKSDPAQGDPVGMVATAPPLQEGGGSKARRGFLNGRRKGRGP